MRILRIRRGFTTNSSASSEWLPGGAQGPGSSTTPGSHGGSSGTPMPPAGPKIGETIIVMPAGSTPQPAPVSWNDGARVGGLISVVALLFVAERAIRRVLKRKRDSDE